MSNDLNGEDQLIWDPIYPSLNAYARHFDYDLLGQKVRRSDRFFEDPEAHIERWLREKRMEVIFTGVSLILAVVGIIGFRVVIVDFLVNSFRYIRYFLAVRSLKKKYVNMIKHSGEAGFDVDVLAGDVYRRIVATRNLYKYSDDTDLVEYEAGRFVWEIITETGLCYEEPRKKRTQELAEHTKELSKESK